MSLPASSVANDTVHGISMINFSKIFSLVLSATFVEEVSPTGMSFLHDSKLDNANIPINIE